MALIAAYKIFCNFYFGAFGSHEIFILACFYSFNDWWHNLVSCYLTNCLTASRSRNFTESRSDKTALSLWMPRTQTTDFQKERTMNHHNRSICQIKITNSCLVKQEKLQKKKHRGEHGYLVSLCHEHFRQKTIFFYLLNLRLITSFVFLLLFVTDLGWKS